MFQITANFYSDFYIYKNGELMMIAKRKYIWFAGVKIKVFSVDDESLLIYRYFSFFYTFIKINYQNLPYKIQLDRSNWRKLAIRINNHQIKCKLNSLPQRKMGSIRIDNKEVAKITNKKIFRSSLEFEIEFIEENKFEIYCILLFLMDISAIESF